jgi:hypothetical protein
MKHNVMKLNRIKNKKNEEKKIRQMLLLLFELGKKKKPEK